MRERNENLKKKTKDRKKEKKSGEGKRDVTREKEIQKYME